ncbi:MAG: hypothetical protein ACRD4O_05590, partial [Bryobacteraceae bacterium]
FVPGGGTQTDVALSGSWQMRPEWILTAFAQCERYFVPILGGPKRNVAAGLQVAFYPTNWKIQRR